MNVIAIFSSVSKNWTRCPHFGLTSTPEYFFAKLGEFAIFDRKMLRWVRDLIRKCYLLSCKIWKKCDLSSFCISLFNHLLLEVIVIYFISPPPRLKKPRIRNSKWSFFVPLKQWDKASVEWYNWYLEFLSICILIHIMYCILGYLKYLYY